MEIDVVIDGLRTHLADIGEGPPVVCVHGGLGSDHHAFRPWFDGLSDEFRLLMVDLQGNGLSDDPPDWESVGLHTWVAQLEGLRRELGYERWVVVGHSFGGIVAQAYAIAHQDRLNGVVIVTSGPAVDRFEERWELAKRHGTPEQAALIESGLLRHMASDEEWERTWDLVAPVYWVDKSWMSQMQRRSRFASRAYNKAVEILGTLDLRPQLPTIGVPTLSIGAAEDWSFPPPVGPRVIADLVPGCEYAEFERSGHYPFVEEGEAFFALLRPWLQRVTSV